jgi:uncharacterized membrane protein YoaK (UPF0700 family)
VVSTGARRITVLGTLLSAAAGSADAIGYLGFGGVFLSFMSGNIVILAAHFAAGHEASFARLLSVPVFITALAAGKAVAIGLSAMGKDSLRPLLALELALLIGCLALGVAGGAASPRALVAAMLGVAAMAVQSVLTRLSALGGASTTVMTTNITKLVLDVSEALLGRRGDTAVRAQRSAVTGLAEMTGFIAGCALGAVAETVFGVRAMALPAGLVLGALVLAPVTLTVQTNAPGSA